MEKHRNYKLAKVFSLIPIITFLIILCLYIISFIGNAVFNIDNFLSVLPLLLSILLAAFGGLPFLIFSILGIIFSIKAKKEINKGTVFLILSAINLLISIVLICVGFYMIFIAGPSI